MPVCKWKKGFTFCNTFGPLACGQAIVGTVATYGGRGAGDEAKNRGRTPCTAGEIKNQRAQLPLRSVGGGQGHRPHQTPHRFLPAKGIFHVGIRGARPFQTLLRQSTARPSRRARRRANATVCKMLTTLQHFWPPRVRPGESSVPPRTSPRRCRCFARKAASVLERLANRRDGRDFRGEGARG
jgi:hypothetical protein